MNFRRIKHFLRRLFSRRKDREINPDEIFLDASNLPAFDQHQFEGRLERPIAKRTHFLVAAVFLFLLLLYAGRVGFLQTYRGEAFARLSESNRLTHSIIFADRGVLYDRTGKELAWNVAGTDDDFALRRYYRDEGLSHAIGYVGYPLKDVAGVYYQNAYIGRGGAESFFDGRLSGDNGLKIVEIDALQKVTSESVVRPPRDGENITLSVDASLSSALFTLLKRRAEESGFVGGAGVVVDISNGEIIALASYPEYDSQTLTDGESGERIQSYVEDSRKPFLNRIVSGLYTPGSIIKPIIAIGALEEGVITPEKEILSTGSIRVPHPYIEDAFSIFVDWKAHGYVDMRRALAVSSNVYFYEVGGGFENQKGIGIEGINRYARMFGLGETSSSPFEGESIGVIPNPRWKEETFNGDEWRIGDTYNTSIGQYGFQVTPMQMALAIGAIANGGTLFTPILEKGTSAEKKVLPINARNTEVVREGMRLGVREGTAQALSVSFVDVAAKTGTAELGTVKQFVNSWVVGFYPYENPRYAFAVIMERGPVKNLVGAASVMREYLEWIHAHAPEYLSPVN
ncbi:hypothetical protein HYW58_00140 [Candidatus Kaiserbacteria bacterium]|nr:hypothetical protein [Candidatus Kaiserbacteria bacterium]